MDEFRIKVNRLEKSNLSIKNGVETSLRSELNSKELEYKKALNIVNEYLKEWEKTFKTERYLEDKILVEKHSVIKQQKLNSSQIPDLNPLVCKLMDKLFEEIKIGNNRIRDKETEIIEVIKRLAIDKFWQIFDSKLGSGFFNGLEVKTMFDKLLDYTINTVNTVSDFKSYQITSVKAMNDKLKSEISAKFAQKYSAYSKKTVFCKNLLERAQRESMAIYLTGIEESLSKMSSIKPKEMNAICSTYKEEAIKNMKKNLQTNISSMDFNKFFFDSILNANIDEFVNKIQKYEQKYRNQFNENQSNDSNSSSFAIHFGGQFLFAGVYDTEFRPVLDKTSQTFRPNCIAFSDKILFGYEAINQIRSTDKDIKG